MNMSINTATAFMTGVNKVNGIVNTLGIQLLTLPDPKYTCDYLEVNQQILVDVHHQKTQAQLFHNHALEIGTVVAETEYPKQLHPNVHQFDRML